MCTDRPALGKVLKDFVTLGAMEFRPEPLWAARPCPSCGDNTLQALVGSDRI